MFKDMKMFQYVWGTERCSSWYEKMELVMLPSGKVNDYRLWVKKRKVNCIPRALVIH